MKMKPSFLFEKNLDLHIMKMQIHFYFEEKFKSISNEIADLFLVLRKRIDYIQIFEIKKEIITIIKDSRSCFK